jgi:hypothetical protein
MKREHSPVHLGLILILGGTFLSLFISHHQDVIPGISPVMAIAFVGAMYLPRRWGWLAGPAVFLITNLAYLHRNYLTTGTMFSWGVLVPLAVYFTAAGLGMLISRRKSLFKVIGGSLGCSLLFYVAANTSAWWSCLTPQFPAGYAPTLAGLWQANTVGLPGYAPSWVFLRNGMAGDLFFVLLLLLVLDRDFLLGRDRAQAKTAAPRPV